MSHHVCLIVHPDPEDDFILDKEVTEDDKAQALKLKNEANQAFASESPPPHPGFPFFKL